MFGLVRWLLLRRLAGPEPARGVHSGFLAAVRQFSRNARLFLTYALLAELGTGIWAVMFNLYLLRMDFSVAFIGTFWLVNMICHGAASLPVGLLADRFGRRQAFFMATALSVMAQAGVLFTQNPAAILVLGGIAGLGQAAHGVTGAPFMMENSERRERPHLFSLNACFLQFSRFGGNMAGGFLPLAWAALLGVPSIAPEAARWALVTGLPLTVLGALPLVFIRERPVDRARSLKDIIALRNVVSFPIIARLTLLSLIFGTAFGLTIRFFNLFFEQAHGATDSEIGTTLALGSLAGAGAILISPVLAHGWGKAPGILVTQTLSVPSLLLMALVPSLTAVTMFFLLRSAIYSVAMPLREQLGMELVGSQERGTTAGFTHTAFDLGGGLGAGMAGLLITSGGCLNLYYGRGPHPGAGRSLLRFLRPVRSPSAYGHRGARCGCERKLGPHFARWLAGQSQPEPEKRTTAGSRKAGRRCSSVLPRGRVAKRRAISVKPDRRQLWRYLPKNAKIFCQQSMACSARYMAGRS